MATKVSAAARNLNGFTLIELVVAMAIAAILATIAYSSYSSSVLKSRRTDARTALLDLAGREESLFSTTNTYSSTPSVLGYTATGDTTPMSVGSGYYTVTIGVPSPQTSPPSFTVTANPVGSQLNDAECTSFTVTQTGAQTSTGTSTACW